MPGKDRPDSATSHTTHSVPGGKGSLPLPDSHNPGGRIVTRNTQQPKPKSGPAMPRGLADYRN